MSEPHVPSAEAGYLRAVPLLAALEASETTTVGVVGALLDRIEAVDRAGPRLRSVLSVDERALEVAAELDEERRSGRLRGPLHGVPVLVKDNIDTEGPLGTTAGSLALAGRFPASDATLVAQLRRAGALVLGKTNLSEWANFRGRPSASGWSAVGGQCRNPHGLDRTPGGSSSGSGAAVAAGLAPLAVGTETDGSILCPAAVNGIVGLKPTVGLVSRSGIVPISPSQDTAGPMGRTVEDVALLLEALAAEEPDFADLATSRRPAHGPGGYLAATRRSAEGLRVGVASGPGFSDYHPPTDAAAAVAVEALRAAGVEVVDDVACQGADDEDELLVLCTEFRWALADYLSRRSEAPGALDDVIAFNEATAAERLDLFGQDLLVRSAASPGLDDAGYLAARQRNWDRTRRDGIDALLERHGVDALVAPAMGPPWLVDYVAGDSSAGAAWGQAAVAGYPSITVPVGLLHGLPVGLALWGRAWSETTLLTLAAALERELGTGSPRPAWAEATASIA